jgi:hypothetical protein
MNKFVLTFLAFTSLLGASMAAAQADTNSSPQLTTVSWVVQTRNAFGINGRFVELIGHATVKIGTKYWFTDGTGTMRLNAGKIGLPMGPSLVIDGRIDHGFLGMGPVEVVLKTWRVGIAP